jgi:hypothetical protein
MARRALVPLALLLLVGCSGLLAPAPRPTAVAGTVVFSWDPVATATSYQIQQSLVPPPVALATDWTVIQTVTPAACTGTPITCVYTYVSPATAYFRWVAINAGGATIRYGEGVWHCASCTPATPPAPPVMVPNLGFQ